jgi:putative transposase
MPGRGSQVEPSVRAVRDAAMMPVLVALWIANRKVYGARKLWKAARRAGHDIGRDATARLMGLMAIQGHVRGGEALAVEASHHRGHPAGVLTRTSTAGCP